MAVMTAKKLVEKAKEIEKLPTQYVYGTYGQRMTEDLIAYKQKQYPRYNTPARSQRYRKLIGKGTAWDCCGLIKGILWGWDKDKGVKYRGHPDVPDMGANGMQKVLLNQSSDFSKIQVGEAVWISGHIGIYIGGGQVIEATTRWTDNVLISSIAGGARQRAWTLHGMLPWVDYSEAVKPKPEPPANYITYTVKKGDTPWGIAQEYYGDGNQYKKIMAASGLKPDATIYVGQELIIPTDQTLHLHTVAKGDTPWGLAERYYGDGREYKKILEASGLAENATIYVGQVLKVPLGKKRVHIVRRGDTPWGLAQKYYGNGSRYVEIMAANGLQINAAIYVGQELLIP